MNTWISRPLLAVLPLCLLTACSQPVAVASAKETALAAPLTSARMFKGVSANAPEGYCFDTSSLTDAFALMARCDMLGMQGAVAGAPLAVITLTLADFAEDNLLSPKALVSSEEALIEAQSRDRLQLAKIDGTPPQAGLSGQYWRGAGQVRKDVLMGLAIYQSEAEDDIGDAAPNLLEEAFMRSGGPVEKAQAGTAPTDTAHENDPIKWVAGLFGRNNSAR